MIREIMFLPVISRIVLFTLSYYFTQNESVRYFMDKNKIEIINKKIYTYKNIMTFSKHLASESLYEAM